MARVVISSAAAFLLLLLWCHAFASFAAASGGRRPPPMLARHLSSSAAALSARQAVTAGGSDPSSMVQYETRWYAQRLDHFNAAPASYVTFQQRYLVNDTFWGGRTAPIFLFAGGEADVELYSNYTGFLWEAAPRFRAMVLFIEHRYYGRTMPFGSREAAFTDASTLGYLTSTQALADYATLVLSLKANLSAASAPVVVFGGSYAGMLAAWMRLKYPHIVVGAVASSAPVLGFYGLADPYAFYDVVTKDFKDESKNCYDVLRKSWNELDDALATEAGRAELNRKFNNICNGNVDMIPELLDAALVGSAMMDYPTTSAAGFRAVRDMCRAIDHPTRSGAGAGAGDAFSRISAAVNVYYSHYAADAADAACFGYASADAAGEPYGGGMVDGWGWQSRTEMVLMTAGVRDGGVARPRSFNFTQMLDEQREYTGLPLRPYWIEAEFGGFDIGNVLRRSASNIVFFNGLRDPWSAFGVLKSISDSIVALVEPQGAHNVDLKFSEKDDPDWLKQVRVKETRIIARWLRQYYRDERISA
ncbi:hypothetical protein EJB05_29413, partial [Eragrostis curvula]